MNFYTWVTKNGQEFKMSLPIRAQITLSRQLGYGAIAGLRKCSEGDWAEFVAVFLWQSFQEFEHGYSLEKVYDVMDSLVRAGYTMDDFLEPITEVMSISGFFDKETLENGGNKKPKKAE